MKVLLRSDVKGVGRRGDVVEVKNGFARNYLLPSGAALQATDTMDAQASAMRRSRDLKDASNRAAAETQRGVSEAAKVVVSARAGANGRLFGSVTESDIVNAIRTATNISLDRHAIHMDEHLKVVGSASVTAHLFEGVDATVNVDVVAKD